MMYRLVKMGLPRTEVLSMRYPEAIKWLLMMGYESHLERKSMEDHKVKRHG